MICSLFFTKFLKDTRFSSLSSKRGSPVLFCSFLSSPSLSKLTRPQTTTLHTETRDLFPVLLLCLIVVDNASVMDSCDPPVARREFGYYTTRPGSFSVYRSVPANLTPDLDVLGIALQRTFCDECLSVTAQTVSSFSTA